VFDNTSGVFALEPKGSAYVGTIFSNLICITKNGQSIARCSVTDNSSNKTVDTLTSIILNN
jgi:hypothetical protein